MNDDSVVKVLQEAQDAVRKCIGMLELEQGFGPITGVYIANYKLLVSEIGDAINYLEKDRSVVCDTCDCVLTPENYKEAHCTACAKEWDTCEECGGAMVTKKTRFCPECCVVTETPDENGWTNCDQWRLP